jgi:hypothetical protein
MSLTVYRGWIPTVSGQLSFQSIGNTVHPSPSVFSNATDKKTRFIIAYQKRWLLDNPLINIFKYDWLREIFATQISRHEGMWWGLCLAKHERNIPPAIDSNNPNYSIPLKGRLFLFNRETWKSLNGVEDLALTAMQELESLEQKASLLLQNTPCGHRPENVANRPV